MCVMWLRERIPECKTRKEQQHQRMHLLTPNKVNRQQSVITNDHNTKRKRSTHVRNTHTRAITKITYIHSHTHGCSPRLAAKASSVKWQLRSKKTRESSLSRAYWRKTDNSEYYKATEITLTAYICMYVCMHRHTFAYTRLLSNSHVHFYCQHTFDWKLSACFSSSFAAACLPACLVIVFAFALPLS